VLVKKSIQFGKYQLTLETGVIARQATAAVMVDLGGTTVLVTAVVAPEAVEGQDFFPLRVDYQEKLYANGKIPGGFIKREGRPSEREILISRLIDRSLRPLFPKGFNNEVQIVATVKSFNPEVDPDLLAMIGASAAISISGAPFNGPMGVAKVGYKDSCYVINPDLTAIKDSKLELVVAGNKSSILMVESEAQELSEHVMLGAVMFGHKQMQAVINLIEEFKDAVNNPVWDWQAPAANIALKEQIKTAFFDQLTAAYKIQNKLERQATLKELRKQIKEQILAANLENGSVVADDAELHTKEITKNIEQLESELVRGNILNYGTRIDGRDLTTVRPISVQTGLLPRTHGSALFTRGETQAIVVVTLGTGKDAKIIEGLIGEDRDTFMLHYNFPPFSVGEIGQMGSPKRREIGHGKLAKRALQAVLPTSEEFGYVIRIVSEITESNGSSSMATVCGSSLALMDAGVPVKAAVAGIAMGLIKEQDKFAVISDILGDEDHLGDMDFKVAGTADGVTALQMDIKTDGITEEIMSAALEQARDGRLHILGIMQKDLNNPKELSPYAPIIINMSINPDKIKDVIGKGGSVIKTLIEDPNTTNIDIQEDGSVQIVAPDQQTGQQIKQKIEDLTCEVEIGKIYHGKVVKIVDFGAFVNILPNQDGLVHISQIANKRVANVSNELSEGQEVKVKVLDIDKQGRLKLSIKACLDTEAAADKAEEESQGV
jgi:polyribonucleotide nucleotidyltransferase